MATKAQEMKALEQIKKIVDELGAESYVGKAFEGCFEIAQENIENDFWTSYKDYVEKYNTVLNGTNEKLATLTDDIKALKVRAEDAEKLLKITEQASDNWCTKYYEADDKATENWNKFREQEDKVEALQMEIIKLKARLFDMMEEKGA